MTNEEREMLQGTDDSCPIDQCSGDPSRCSRCYWEDLAKRVFAEVSGFARELDPENADNDPLETIKGAHVANRNAIRLQKERADLLEAALVTIASGTAWNARETAKHALGEKSK